MSSKRLLSLDILRGITIAGMIMVNNPGSWSTIYEPLKHAEWNGLTPTDLVFPFFMFIMGISSYFSLRAFNFEWNAPAVIKIVKRTIIIFSIGLGLNYLGILGANFNALAEQSMPLSDRLAAIFTDLSKIRILGVFQRLALCYGLASLVALAVKERYWFYAALAFLVVYFVILINGHGFEPSLENIVGQIDRSLFGAAHLYKQTAEDGTVFAFDPEGLLSTLASVSHVLFGMITGGFLIKIKDNNLRIQQIFISGTLLLFAGLLLAYGCPVNKKIWSPTFVLQTCGYASLLLALLIWLIDIKGKKNMFTFFHSFGINPLFIYIVAALLARLISLKIISTSNGLTGIGSYFYTNFLAWAGELGSLIFALLFVLICWLICYPLYKKNIIIKI